MTFLDMAKQERNILNEEHLIQDTCPSDLGYEPKEKCKTIIGLEEKDKAYICRRCWEREMPNTNQKEDGIPVIPQSEIDSYNKGHKDGVAQGLNDAWEFMSKLYSITTDVAYGIFGTSCIEKMFRVLAPQEAIAKMKAYEEAQKIKVGDVVDVYGDIGVVSSLGTDKDRYHVLFKDGITNIYGKTIPIKKTGKHIDISSILEQIGE